MYWKYKSATQEKSNQGSSAGNKIKEFEEIASASPRKKNYKLAIFAAMTHLFRLRRIRWVSHKHNYLVINDGKNTDP